jgi:sporulation protein YlmC with PRC-barrel domain
MGAMEDAKSLVGKNLLGTDGEKIGRINAIYVDAGTGEPEWVAVNMGGLLGGKVAFAPVAQVTREGEDAVVAYEKQHVKHAPKAQTEGAMSPAEEEKLCGYYGIDRGQREPSGSQDAASWLSR